MRILIIILISFLVLYTGCKENSSEPKIHDIDTNVVVRKPNLYIYPESEIDLKIEIGFPLGGEIVASDPSYGGGWNVNIKPDGKINGEYEYLFYEFTVPDYHQKDFGWIVKSENLKEFFMENMKQAGFSESEIDDFLKYWIPELIDYPFYAIYPQFRNTLDLMTEIKFSVEIDHFYRLHYFIKGLDNRNSEIEQPVMISSRRKGFYAVEWGVIIE